MVTTVVVGLGSGYFLWGTRVARLTEALSGLTLELDTMRARLAAPRGDQSEEGAAKAAAELRVINESMAAFRQELAEQKSLIEKSSAAAVPPETAAVAAELRTVRNELAACIADKQDLELRCKGAPAAPGAAPAYPPPAPRYRPPAAAPPAEASPPRSPGVGLDDPRY
jgi:hypothetical protein